MARERWQCSVSVAAGLVRAFAGSAKCRRGKGALIWPAGQEPALGAGVMPMAMLSVGKIWLEKKLLGARQDRACC
ncbi:MAG: hypothetical protein AN484_25540 [Aphanizomenon flos-aquae WA102]|uniref:Uncharacterized protein n=1 Tax=Aphanizomenon flos-aquae WA102 TaxID=1710896 RepID=A0A1B7WI17_APHFL|nr:MAG: hypothetical protein AN484_25540 [Aphanizomenon flos-aquae WA102]